MERRGLAAPLLFLGAILAALGSVEASPTLWAASLALLAAGAWCIGQATAPGPTPLAIALWSYALWLSATNALANPGYTAAAPYHAAFLALGFALGRRLEGEVRERFFGLLLAGALSLSLWGLVQVSGGAASRAHAHFETPTTFGAVINFALVPALALLLWGQRPVRWACIATVLAAGLAAGESRGAILALAFALLAALVFARWQAVALAPRRALAAAGALAAGWAIAALAPELWRALSSASGAAQDAHALLGEAARSSLLSRFELYSLALDAARGNWLLGIGYLGFHSALEAGRLAVPSYGAQGVTYFAHNDWLQTLLELGVPGFAAFLAMVLLPFAAMLRRGPSRAAAPPLAALGALAAMAALGAMDFPFHIPLCLLLFGLAAGQLDRALAPEGALRPRWQAPPARLAAIVIAGLGGFALGAPLAADAAAAAAQRAWRAGESERAAYWFEVARRFEPRDWRYHWYAGQFWHAQAALAGKPEAARLADEAFAAGFAANPRVVENLLGRIATHRRFGALLAQPADAATLRRWAEEAARLAPLRAAVQAERARLGTEGAR